MSTIPNQDISGKARELLDRVVRLQMEAMDYRTTQEPIWDSNISYYIGDQAPPTIPPGLRFYAVNLTQTAILSTAAIQVENQPEIRIVPNESNEPIQYAVDTRAFAPEMLSSLGIQPQPGSTTVIVPADKLQALAPLMSSQGVDPATGQPVPPVIPPAAVTPIDDVVRSEILQTVFDCIVWDRSDMHYRWTENIIHKGVVGFQDMLLSWDFANNRVEAVNIHPKNVWAPPNGYDPTCYSYLYVAEPLSREQALAAYPNFAEIIERQATQGVMTGIGQYTLGDPYSQLRQQRMVTVFHVWLRDEPTPVPIEDALQKGSVQRVIADDVTEPPGEQVMDPLGETVGEQQAESPDTATADTFVLPDGSLTTFGDDNWPTVPMLRQLLLIAPSVTPQVANAELAEDVPCPYDDIPVVRNINIPIPYRPDGQGEPERLKPLQDQLNRIGSIFGNHIGYFQSPQVVMSQNAATDLGDKQGTRFSHPGSHWVVPSEELVGGAKPIEFVDPPSLNESYMAYYRQLIELFKEVSGNQDVLQGYTPSGVDSGRAIDSLQSAARTVIGLRSELTKRSMKQHTKLVLGMIRDYLNPVDAAKICKKYPPNVVEMVLKGISYDECEISIDLSGSSTRQAEDQKTFALVQSNLIDPLTALERLRVPNAKMIVDRMQSAATAAAQQVAAQQQQQQQDVPTEKPA